MDLTLTPLTQDDFNWMFDLFSDERGWRHFPEGRHTDVSATQSFLGPILEGWDRDGLSYWAARLPDGTAVGMGGVRMIEGRWNLGFRIQPEYRGKGYATRVAAEGIAAANRVGPNTLVVAWVDPTNAASSAILRRVGMIDHGLKRDAGEVFIAFTDRVCTFDDQDELVG